MQTEKMIATHRHITQTHIDGMRFHDIPRKKAFSRIKKLVPRVRDGPMQRILIASMKYWSEFSKFSPKKT